MGRGLLDFVLVVLIVDLFSIRMWGLSRIVAGPRFRAGVRYEP